MFVVVRSPYNFQCRKYFFRLLTVLLLTGLPGIMTAAAAATGASGFPAYKNTVEWQYKQAGDYYYTLRNNPSLAGRREKWLTGIYELQRIYRIDPKSTRASACLYTIARMYRAMYERFGVPADLDKAVSFYTDILTFFPNGNKADNALYALARIEQEDRGNFKQAVQYYDQLMRSYPTSSKKRLVKRQLEKLIDFLEKHPDYKEKTVAPVPRAARTVPTPAPVSPRVVPSVVPPVLQKPAVSQPLAESRTSTVASTGISTVTSPPLPAPVKSVNPINPVTPVTPVPPATPAEKVKPVAAPAPVQNDAVKNAVKNANSSIPQTIAPPVQKSRVTVAPPAQEEKAVPRTKIVLSALKKVDSARQNKKEMLAEIQQVQQQEENKEADKPVPQQEVQQNADQTADRTVDRGIRTAPPAPRQNPPTAENNVIEHIDTAEKYLEKVPGTVDVLPVQYWSSDHYSRVVIKSSKPVAYRADLLDQQNGVPRHLFIDFQQSYIPPKYRSPVFIDDGLLKRIHTSQLDATTVRVSLDTESIGDYKVFNLKDPFRVVVDVRGRRGGAVRIPQRKVAPQIITDIKPLVVRAGREEESQARVETPAEAQVVTAANESASETASETVSERVSEIPPEIKPEVKPEKIITPRKRKTVPVPAKTEKAPVAENLTLAQQLGLGVRRIVIDPGHGGKDPGAVGFGLKEKDIVLNVAKKIKKILEEKNGYEVLLTRDDDISLSLEERTAIANTKEADLFLSIHVNAHPEETIRGVETFYLNLATHTEAMRVAALENATSTHNMSEMQDILSELMQNEKINESSQLAEFVQLNMIDGLKKQKFQVKDLGVKQAPFYVLIGAEMPAILAEISFITNPEDAKLLKSEKYLQTLAEQIVAGVLSYAENQRAAALNIAPSPEISAQ
jgi:N-acetylmuramoyl-L-alanine amidase